MKRSLAADLFKRIANVDPPGSCSDFVEHPMPGLRARECVEIGYMLEHRFAFHYWLKCKQKLMTDRHTGTRWNDAEFVPPDLITWDWHDDVGGECDYLESELKRLDQANEQEVALFCWAGLHSINDGHIAPAIWLNALGNVYILQRQRNAEECENENRTFVDRYGRSHEIRYFRSPQDLDDCFAETNTGAGVMWDMDMDFFTEEEEVPDQPYTPPLPKRKIRSLLNVKKPWMQAILTDLKAITIALEPKYTGGLTHSLELYRIWEDALFSAPVFSTDCRWRASIG